MDINFDDVSALELEECSNNQDLSVLTLDFSSPPTFYQAEIVPHQSVIWKPLAIDVSGGDIYVSIAIVGII